MHRVDLFIVDGQNDFLHPNGALYVKNADQEAIKLANMIQRLGKRLSKLHETLDSHHFNDCSHNIAWKGENGNPPPAFTIVTNEDVKNHKWVPKFSIGVWEGKVIPSYQWALNYTEALEKQGRCPL